MKLNFILKEMTAIRYFIPLVIAGNNRNMRSVFYIGGYNKYNTPKDHLMELYILKDKYHIILKGADKVDEINGPLFIIENVGICGIRGCEKDSPYKIRELTHLQNALNKLSRAEIDLAICMLHYPPCSSIFKNPEESFAEDHLFDLMVEHNINKIVYGHLHSDQPFKINLHLKVENIDLYCTSIDYFNWQPIRIL